jgi:hypothetical protein
LLWVRRLPGKLRQAGLQPLVDCQGLQFIPLFFRGTACGVAHFELIFPAYPGRGCLYGLRCDDAQHCGKTLESPHQMFSGLKESFTNMPQFASTLVNYKGKDEITVNTIRDPVINREGGTRCKGFEINGLYFYSA